MTDPSHDRIAPHLSDYAFGFLAADERAAVDAHVRGCAECIREVEELRLVMHGLARVPDAIAPPADLKRRVLDRLARERQPAPRDGVAAERAGARRAGWNGAWLAAAAALILVLAGGLLRGIVQQRRTAGTLAARTAEVDALHQRLATYASQADLALSILTAGDMRRAELTGGNDPRAGSVARAYWSPTRGLLIAADRLPAPPAGRVYQVWIITGRTPLNAGLLGSPENGRGMLIVPAPAAGAAGPITIAVTDEPPGGLPAPTGNKHLVGSL